jgi:transcription elongation GreA/GreB family factor
MAEKKKITYEGLQKLEDELQDLKVNRRKEVAEKIKEARELGDLSENAEYDAAKDEQRDIEARIEEIEKEALQKFAKENDLTISQVVRRAIKDFLLMDELNKISN